MEENLPTDTKIDLADLEMKISSIYLKETNF